ncbi:ABC transporter ATP-binding protein [Amycolatopsis acidiphila]|uniref:ABC transporter ATP-binding protein n=1 Tax=Amycolatopsis acidiphila TaxID=715473 RepID=A0A557ZZT7_9PSEU|nr:ABC transporter ATP-binding protein [Amycolatopsis acidiphila]TVT17519.1 ABC transporter ATP-binding protein [Amycolatopsis acidiphila]UIJ57653.1 ABC transporter ATP-binding protein [Amycolatopsis acidiphila]GHG95537.1 ABC transporter ATP-binding protein [Amycolatopsis acidiphila]
MTLSISGLHASHGATRALRDVSLHVESGRILALVGANGAGKSTLLHCVAGLHRPDQGQVSLHGKDVTGLPVHQVAQRKLCLVPAGRQLFSDLSVADNLRVGLHGLKLSGTAERARVDRVHKLFPILREFTGRKAGLLSGGQQQMLAIGRALVREPAVLLLDEPSLGLAPMLVTQILRTVAGLAADGVAILLAEQNAAAALQVADHGAVLENGRVTRADTATALLADEDISRHYLGKAAAESAPDAPVRRLPAGLSSLAH